MSGAVTLSTFNARGSASPLVEQGDLVESMGVSDKASDRPGWMDQPRRLKE